MGAEFCGGSCYLWQEESIGSLLSFIIQMRRPVLDMPCVNICRADAPVEINRQSTILLFRFVEHYEGAALVQDTVECLLQY